ncbi:hypothetical protein MYXO_02502 [Myxococcaceae bacterium]|nr:hypothetical protein MYXO_02502 [Myxococcaceae bacterium]
MSVIERLRRASELAPDELLRRIRTKLADEIRAVRDRRRDRRLPTYARPRPQDEASLEACFHAPAVERFRFRAEAIREHAANALAHRFDLLGSGLVSSDYGAAVKGFAGHVHPCGASVDADPDGRWMATRIPRANLEEARRTWRLVSPGYRPIDWQRDLRSGHRWNEGLAARDQGLDRFPPPGADVKLPWELARMQHLPLLAWAYALSRSGEPDFEGADRYRIEFCDEIADFRAMNPPRFGVQWACTMDVAIRVVSWIAAHDLFRGFGAAFPAEWSATFSRAVREHARHIAENLERAGPVRANHYLADVAGLAFAAAALPRDVEVDGWLWFAAHELRREIGLQFHSDGSNFEASTAYHRLSAEMALVATALLTGLPGDRRELLSKAPSRAVCDSMPAPTAGSPAWDEAGAPLPLDAEHWGRIHGMGRFARACTSPDGSTPWIGDEDGGRFLKLVPRWRPNPSSDGSGPRWIEVGADLRHVAELAECLVGKLPLPGTEASWEAAALPGVPVTGTGPNPHPEDGTSDGVHAYPGIGIFVLRRGSDFLTFRCGSVGQAGNGGHAHNDQLSVTLHLGGRCVLVDPGTYVYTALPGERNRFRSTAMHNTLQVDDLEQNPWSETRAGLFELRDRSRARIEHVDAHRLVGSHGGFGIRHRREVRLAEDGIRVDDSLDAPRRWRLFFHFACGTRLAAGGAGGGLRVELEPPGQRLSLRVGSGSVGVLPGRVSPGYGLVESAPVAVVEAEGSAISWSLVREMAS